MRDVFSTSSFASVNSENAAASANRVGMLAFRDCQASLGLFLLGGFNSTMTNKLFLTDCHRRLDVFLLT